MPSTFDARNHAGAGFRSVVDLRRAVRLVQPQTAEQLHGYIRAVLGFRVPQRAMISGHQAPFQYVLHSYFEELHPQQRDCIVWANRGGGKTQIGAIVTLLDLLFKPGVQVRILGGSLEQSSKMLGYLRVMLESDVFNDLLAGPFTMRGVELINGSRVEVLSQSEKAVRGQRVHKLRCDEVELFDADIWEAAQMVTRSGRCGSVHVRASIDALSTMHKPFGLMSRLVDHQLTESRAAQRRLFRWSVLDVLEHCPPQRSCPGCPLWGDCQGRAKQAAAQGFVHIDDAIQQQARIGLETWQAEMLCERPNRSDSVYPEFDTQRHVVSDTDADTLLATCRAVRDGRYQLLGGIDFGYRAPTVVLLAVHDADRDVLTIVDELIVQQHIAATIIQLLRERLAQRSLHSKDIAWLGVDPAGHQRNDQTGRSTISLWRSAGFVVRTRPSAIIDGVAAVRTRLQRADGSVGLQCAQRCTALIQAMRMYHYDPATSTCSRDDANLPVKDGPDHACDALRYLIVNLDGQFGRIIQRLY